MNTPRIEIEATEEIEQALKLAVLWLTHYGPTGSEQVSKTLKTLLVEVTRARCLQKRYDEQQITLPLPRP